MNADDPKFTAYALDELDPTERAAVEAALRAQPALAAELEEMRRFTAQLRGELHAEEGAPLRPEQRTAVLGLAPRVVAGPRAWWRRAWVQSAAAACVIVGVSAAIVARVEMKTPHVALGKSRGRGMELRLEPEADAQRAPGDFTGLPVAAPELAAGKPADTGANANPGLAWTAAVPRFAEADSQSPLLVPPANSRDAAPTPPARSTFADRDAVATNDGLVFRQPFARAKTKEQTEPGVLKERGRVAGSFPKLGIGYDSQAAGQGPALLDAGVTARRDAPPGNRRAPAGPDDKDVVRRSLPEANAAEPPGSTEAYEAITENPFRAVKDQPLSTFSVDVNTASYANVRRFLTANERPPKDAVRIEELLNYFHYDYPKPGGADPFSCALEVAACPWQTEHRLVRIGLRGRDLSARTSSPDVNVTPDMLRGGKMFEYFKRVGRPAANLVFLIDVSSSMQPENRLPLVKQSLGLLVDQLSADDTVAIAVYAGTSGCVLEPTHDRNKMRAALDHLEAGGPTNGAAGIQLAYDLAQRSFKKGGTNRVILCTAGDFNVGVASQGELAAMIQDKAKTGIFLSVFGVGMGSLKDATLEKLADKGHGSYGYIDTLAEGQKLFVEEMAGTLFTIAKDVKVQVEFNPAQVAGYRLIGYENRSLAKEDFNDDTKDGGGIGAGHTVTALYEIVPAGKEVPNAAPVDDLKYQKLSKFEEREAKGEAASKELLTVKLRYKEPDGDVSKKLEFPLTDSGATWEKSSRDFRWAASIVSFGLLLRDSPHKGSANWNMTLALATGSKGEDRDGYRSEFVGLVERAKALSR